LIDLFLLFFIVVFLIFSLILQDRLKLAPWGCAGGPKRSSDIAIAPTYSHWLMLYIWGSVNWRTTPKLRYQRILRWSRLLLSDWMRIMTPLTLLLRLTSRQETWSEARVGRTRYICDLLWLILRKWSLILRRHTSFNDERAWRIPVCKGP
jgi:hypothetical protein